MSLQVFRDQGYRITFYCDGYTARRACSSGWPGNWDQLIQYFGLEGSPDRAAILPLVTCPFCGRPGDALTIHPPLKNPDEPATSWNWHARLDRPLGPEEQRNQARRDEEFRINGAHAEVARQVAKEQLDRFRALAKWEKKLEEARDRGIFLIGPPNPHRFKKFRPPMKD